MAMLKYEHVSFRLKSNKAMCIASLEKKHFKNTIMHLKKDISIAYRISLFARLPVLTCMKLFLNDNYFRFILLNTFQNIQLT